MNLLLCNTIGAADHHQQMNGARPDLHLILLMMTAIDGETKQVEVKTVGLPDPIGDEEVHTTLLHTTVQENELEMICIIQLDQMIVGMTEANILDMVLEATDLTIGLIMVEDLMAITIKEETLRKISMMTSPDADQ